MYIQHQVSLSAIDDEMLSFLRAISVDMIHVDLRRGGGAVGDVTSLRDGVDHTEAFEKAREQVEGHGMTLNNLFMSSWDAITLGRPDMDDKIDAWGRMLESMGRAGIKNLGWNFKPRGNFRTTSDTGRGGVAYSTFDREEFDGSDVARHDPPVDEDAMWERMEAFLGGVLPVAKKAGVRMALHPDDPPIPEPLGGVAQICSTLEQFRRIFDMGRPEEHGMVFCQGCMTELVGEGVYDVIEEFSGAGRIAWVHFRNVRGILPRFAEVFIDEGDIDMRRAMTIYRDNGFDGPYMMDHTPRFPQAKAGWAGIAYAVGYIRALIQDVYR
jgi:mannonate dehydratase